jgi:putative flippase GtrA
MPDTVAALPRQHLGWRAAKYAFVSLIAVAISQVVLLIGHGGFGWSAVMANVVAVSVGCVPSYTLNRYWVWGKRGRNHLVREVLPFWGLALVGLVFSTVAVAVADRWWDSTLLIAGANLAAFGVLWVAKFALFDALMFGGAK